MQRTASVKRPGKGAARFRRYLPLYLMLLPVIIYYLVFVYAPMGGLIIEYNAIRKLQPILIYFYF